MVSKLIVLLLQERLSTLKKQVAQITLQAQREKESFLKERSNLEEMLQRVCRYYSHVHISGLVSTYAWKDHPVTNILILFEFLSVRRKINSPN